MGSLARLTPREREIYTHLIEGERDKFIADKLFISLRTAKDHVSHILEKLGMPSRAKLIASHYKSLYSQLPRGVNGH